MLEDVESNRVLQQAQPQSQRHAVPVDTTDLGENPAVLHLDGIQTVAALQAQRQVDEAWCCRFFVVMVPGSL